MVTCGQYGGKKKNNNSNNTTTTTPPPPTTTTRIMLPESCQLTYCQVPQYSIFLLHKPPNNQRKSSTLHHKGNPGYSTGHAWSREVERSTLEPPLTPLLGGGKHCCVCFMRAGALYNGAGWRKNLCSLEAFPAPSMGCSCSSESSLRSAIVFTCRRTWATTNKNKKGARRRAVERA